MNWLFQGGCDKHQSMIRAFCLGQRCSAEGVIVGERFLTLIGQATSGQFTVPSAGFRFPQMQFHRG